MQFKSRKEHGREGKKSWAEPTLVTRCDKINREDQGNSIKCNEYLDDEKVLNKKMSAIAKMIRKSAFTITYTGAGLSKASGISDYATKAENSIVNYPKIRSPLHAEPTYSHHILKRMIDADLLHYWIQQNHDGLPQKAGVPQDKINEIHGAWFDPSNRVVNFDGKLRSDLFDDMIEVEKKTTLCLCLGTSLSGMNADRMAKTPAKLHKKNREKYQGLVIINLQKTKMDRDCSIRVWAKLDDAFAILAKKLKIDHNPPAKSLADPPFPIDQRIFWVPYNEEGKLDRNCLMKLDLNDKKRVKICQPFANNFSYAKGKIIKREGEMNWLAALKDEDKVSRGYAFGWWMIAAAINGSLPYLPLSNLHPKVVYQNNDDNENILFNDEILH